MNLHRYLRYESPNVSQHSKNPETQDDFSKQNWQQTKLRIENFRQPPPQQCIYHFKEIVHPCPVSMSGFAFITSGPISKGYSAEVYVTMQMVAWQTGFCLPTWGTTMLKLYVAYYDALHCSLFCFFSKKMSGSQIQNYYGSCINIVVLRKAGHAVGPLLVVLVDG